MAGDPGRRKSRPGNRHKSPLIGWNSRDPTLKPWVEAEAARRGITRRELLDEALAGYRERIEGGKDQAAAKEERAMSTTRKPCPSCGVPMETEDGLWYCAEEDAYHGEADVEGK